MLILVFILSACATAPRKIWRSEPPLQSVENQAFVASLEPVHKGKSFYTWFRFTLSNKGEKTLAIDWNKSRYLHNGRMSGIFIFEGLDPKTIKLRTIPADRVMPGATFTRLIAPQQLVAFAPLRERNVLAREEGISPGLIPAGENGIMLVLHKDGTEIREKLIVRIVEAMQR